MNEQDLLKAVNPSYTTGKGCLGLLMAAGEPDAVKLAGKVDMSEIMGAKSSSAEDPIQQEIVGAYRVAHDARYAVWNRIAEESGCDTIVDLPCGYLPHGLAVSRMGKQYYGLELPVVINEIKPAMEELSGHDPAIHYHAVDATNYDSLNQALKDVKGKICIITDGMLGFFNPSELKEVCQSIGRLLREHGGSWYTSDAMSIELMAFAYEAVWQKDPQVVFRAVAAGSASKAEIDNSINPFIAWSYDERKKLMEEQGFNVREFPYSEKLPELRTADADLMQRLREVLSKMKEWELTVRAEAASEERAGKFSVATRREGDTVYYEIFGRVDTITSPELLKAFENGGKGEKIIVDAAKMQYISSSGLRVLMMMRKSLKDNGSLQVINCSQEVKDIFEVTGFDSMFDIV